MLCRDVGFLGDVGLLIVQSDGRVETAAANALPAALIQSGLFETSLVKLPLEELVLRL